MISEVIIRFLIRIFLGMLYMAMVVNAAILLVLFATFPAILASLGSVWWFGLYIFHVIGIIYAIAG